MASEAPKYKSQPPLSFGLLLSPELAASVLEKGPAADSPEVTKAVSIDTGFYLFFTLGLTSALKCEVVVT